MKRRNTLVLLAAAGILAGCGGSSEPDPCEEAGKGNFPLLNGLACLGEIFDSKPGAPPASGIGGSGDQATTGSTEFEPNTDISNANVVNVGNGISIIGALGRDDPSDNFVFTPKDNGSYAIYLCGKTCDTARVSDVQTLMVLDQTQTTVAATPVATVSPQLLSVAMNAGLAYYVRVDGASTGNYVLMIVPHDTE